MGFISIAEKGLLPDFLIRAGIRKLLGKRLKDCFLDSEQNYEKNRVMIFDKYTEKPIAVETTKANEQHYEVPTEFYENFLGKNMKYSCCYFSENVHELDEAECKMLELTCVRAEITDGMDILELGCGWGSLTLWIAENYPNSKITGLSNSKSQREHIMKKADERGLNNLKIITCDINDFNIENKFDRIVSVEMFEHTCNFQKLFFNISGWLKEKGKLFVHVFSHKEYFYKFDISGDDNWMGKYFFTGGIMPSDNMLLYFQDNLNVSGHWKVPGFHYKKTAEKWLQNMKKNKNRILKILSAFYGIENSVLWYNRWRIFLMSCAELWGYNSGKEWIVSHYLFNKK